MPRLLGVGEHREQERNVEQERILQMQGDPQVSLQNFSLLPYVGRSVYLGIKKFIKTRCISKKH